MSNSYFSFKRFTVRQEKCAMKVGTDGTLLGAWATLPPGIALPRILDVGTGTGLIALMMAQRFDNATVKAIDIDEDAVCQATENVIASPFSTRVSVEKIALQELQGTTFDAIVCNPPYFVDSLKCPDDRRTVARHADSLRYEELMSASFRLLDSEGELSVVIPADSVGRMNSAAAIAGFHQKRICGIKTTPSKPTKRFLLAYSKQHAKTVPEESEVVIGDENYKRMMSEFYLHL